jgi:hypothetical protein
METFSTEDILPESVTRNEIDEVRELPCDGSLQWKFMKMNFTEFWLARWKEYPLISNKAVKYLLVFSTTYLCKCGFSSKIYMKNKNKNRLSTEPDLRQTKPDIQKLYLAKQARPSQRYIQLLYTLDKHTTL